MKIWGHFRATNLSSCGRASVFLHKLLLTFKRRAVGVEVSENGAVFSARSTLESNLVTCTSSRYICWQHLTSTSVFTYQETKPSDNPPASPAAWGFKKALFQEWWRKTYRSRKQHLCWHMSSASGGFLLHALLVEMEKHTQHILNSFHLYSKRIGFQSAEVDLCQELHQPISNAGLSHCILWVQSSETSYPLLDNVC